MFIDQGHKVHSILKYAGVSPSTWYKKAKEGKPSIEKSHSKGRPRQLSRTNSGNLLTDDEVKDNLRELRGRRFLKELGYKKLANYLRRDFDLIINNKKVYRLYKAAGIELAKKKKNKRRGKKVCENREVTGPNQLWQFDIKYGYIDGENRFFFLMAFIDTFNREVVDYHVGLRCQAKDILFTLNIALEKSNAKKEDLVIRSDNGPQMTSHKFTKRIEEHGLEHEFTPPGTPDLNAYVESFFSIVDRELFKGRVYESYSEAYGEMVDFISHYNKDRPHGSLNMMTPKEFTRKFEKDTKKEPELVA